MTTEREEEEVHDGFKFMALFDTSGKKKSLHDVVDFLMVDLDDPDVVMERLALVGFVGDIFAVVKGGCAVAVLSKRVIDLVGSMTAGQDRIVFGPDCPERDELTDLSLKLVPKTPQSEEVE